jgi:hypothetical protein
MVDIDRKHHRVNLGLIALPLLASVARVVVDHGNPEGLRGEALESVDAAESWTNQPPSDRSVGSGS